MIKNLDEKMSYKFLKKQKDGYLGCVLENGSPYVVPVNYVFGDNCLYIHSLPGQKLSAMESNPKVCLQTDLVEDDGFEWLSVIAFGEFEKVLDKRKRTEILQELYKRFPRFTPVEALSDDQDITDKIIVFRLKIKQITGLTETYWTKKSKEFLGK